MKFSNKSEERTLENVYSIQRGEAKEKDYNKKIPTKGERVDNSFTTTKL